LNRVQDRSRVYTRTRTPGQTLGSWIKGTYHVLAGLLSLAVMALLVYVAYQAITG